MASGKVMDPEKLNENVKKTVYAVRGELYLRASELQKEGKKVGGNREAFVTKTQMLGNRISAAITEIGAICETFFTGLLLLLLLHQES